VPWPTVDTTIYRTNRQISETMARDVEVYAGFRPEQPPGQPDEGLAGCGLIEFPLHSFLVVPAEAGTHFCHTGFRRYGEIIAAILC
jgi:hypothetical protein